MKNLSALTFEQIAKKVRWEKNSLVTRSPNIFAGQIIPKTTTDEFPCDAVTVRFNSISKMVATAHFCGKAGKARWNNKHYPSTRLRVTMPSSNKYGEYGYSWNGDQPNDMTEYEMADILHYINSILYEMKDSKF